HPSDVAVPLQHPPTLQGPALELILPPCRIGLGELDLADDPIQDQVEQFVLAADVGIQRRSSGIEGLGDATHREPVDSIPVDDLESHLDDPIPIEYLTPGLHRCPP